MTITNSNRHTLVDCFQVMLVLKARYHGHLRGQHGTELCIGNGKDMNPLRGKPFYIVHYPSPNVVNLATFQPCLYKPITSAVWPAYKYLFPHSPRDYLTTMKCIA